MQDPDAAVVPPDDRVSLTITKYGIAVPGIAVYFQNADSSVVLETTTDAAGTASTAMAPGGFVTAIDAFPSPGESRLSTFAGVKPGDHFALDINRANNRLPDPQDFVHVTLAFPEDPDAAVNHYDIFTSCGDVGFAMSPQPAALEHCGGATDVVVVSVDAQSRPLHTFSAAAVPLVEGGTVKLAGTYGALTSVPLAYKNVPLDAAIVDVSLQQRTSRGLFRQPDATRAQVMVSGGVASAVLDVRVAPVPAAAANLGIEHITPFGSSTHTIHNVLRWAAAGEPRPSLDLQQQRLVEFASAATFDLGGRTIAWTPGTTGLAPEHVVAQMFFQHFSPSFSVLVWDLAGPYTGGTVAFPKLPDAAPGPQPQAGDMIRVSKLLATKPIGGYGAVHEHGLNVDDIEYAHMVIGTSGVMPFAKYF